MNALVWRLHRNQAYTAAAALAALTAVLLISGIAMARGYHDFLATCAAARDCGDTGQVFDGYGVLSTLVSATMAIPLLFGLFWGAPLLAKEFEDGTHGLAWTQGVTRRRWLSRTLAWALLAAVVWGAALAALVTWWRGPENAAGVPTIPLAPGIFDIQGVVPVAYSVFAVALGIAAGSAFRRVLPAMATTFAVFSGLRFVLAAFARRHYIPPISRLSPLTLGGRAPAGSWVLSTTAIGPNGQNFAMGPNIPAACRATGKFQIGPCLSAHGFHTLTIYQPADRFWALQGIEAGIFVVLAAALIAVTYRLVLARDA